MTDAVEMHPSVLRDPLPAVTALHRSPFAWLGASVQDDRRRISALAEDLSLTADPEACTRAKNDLISSRQRLTAEIAWLPGVEPGHAKAFLSSLHTRVDLLRGRNTLPPLANANLIAAAFELLRPDISADLWCEWIIAFAEKVDAIDPNDVLRAINTDRATAGFPPIGESEPVETALRERRRYFSEVVRAALDELPSEVLVALVGRIVERTTGGGEDHAPQLIHDIVDRYEIHAGQFLGPEAENIAKLVEAIRRDAPQGEEAIRKLVARLDALVRRWDSVAQPIQLSKRAQGLTDERSCSLALHVRELCVDLFNKHEMLDTARHLNHLLSSSFGDIPEIEEKLRQDREVLDSIAQDWKGARERQSDWAESITYEAQVGLILKKKLRISPAGIEWKGRTVPLESISGVRWCAVRSSINGIPTGTEYRIEVTSSGGSLRIDAGSDAVYQAFLGKLWNAVGARLIRDLLAHLKTGGLYRIGGVTIDDAGITLTRSKFIGSEEVYTRWLDVQYSSSADHLHIFDKNNKRISARLSYSDVYNVHVLETVIRLAAENWKGALSASIA